MSGNLSDLGFDARTTEPRAAFDALPAGDYDVVIVNSEKKATKAGDGAYIELTLQVCNGQFQNRKLFDRLNLWNANEKTVAIARGTLSAICRALGVMSPNDTAELHNRPGLRCKVAVGKDDKGNPKNEVKGYTDRHAKASQPMAQPQPAQQPAANPQLMTQPSYPAAPLNPF